MRSLPPPRYTRKRRWRRIKRAVASFFSKGCLTDRGAFMPHQPYTRASVSTIKRSRLSSRFRKENFTDGVNLRDGADGAIRTAGFVGKLASRSMPILRPMRKSPSMNLSVRF